MTRVVSSIGPCQIQVCQPSQSDATPFITEGTCNADSINNRVAAKNIASVRWLRLIR